MIYRSSTHRIKGRWGGPIRLQHWYSLRTIPRYWTRYWEDCYANP